MPSELVTRIDLDAIFPEFLDKFLGLLAACRCRGYDYVALSGYRSFTDQMKLYLQGRTTPGAIVTRARAGESCHNFGIAVDVVHDADLKKPGLQMDWTLANYKVLAEEGGKLGLQVGVPGPLGDAGHIQLPLSNGHGRKESVVLAELKALYLVKKDMAAAWARLTALGPW